MWFSVGGFRGITTIHGKPNGEERGQVNGRCDDAVMYGDEGFQTLDVQFWGVGASPNNQDCSITGACSIMGVCIGIPLCMETIQWTLMCKLGFRGYTLGGCQNYGAFYNAAPNPKKDHNFDNHPHVLAARGFQILNRQYPWR